MLNSIAFIGNGVMTEAMIGGLLDKQLVAPDGIVASGPRENRRAELTKRYGIRSLADNREAARDADIVVLAVKPQMLVRILRELKGILRSDQLVISIAAGGRIAAMVDGLAHGSVVRAMPNSPMQIGEGITVWAATPSVTEVQRTHARAIFQALGTEIFVDEEKYLDMATAVSGTGPAYLFLVLEALIDAAVHLGFPRHLAHDLVVETMRGSIIFAQKTNKHPAELRNMVTSPGGTSAEAIYQMEKGTIRTVLSKAVWAAYQRSRQLGDSLGRAEAKHLIDG